MTLDENSIAKNFLCQSSAYLGAELFPRIEYSLQMLTEDQLWWRPNHESNSIGNLMLHLAGNVRQWIIAGVGAKPDTRKRNEEFEARGLIAKEELYAKLRATVDEAGEILLSLSPSALSERRTIQGMNISVLEAIYHVVEHFSMHTGQILYIAKLITGKDLHLYAFDEKGNAQKMW
jgi:uncharacterized damage-inducible protein DinB